MQYKLSQLTARSSNDGFRLQGRKAIVIAGHCAGKLIVSARTPGAQLDEDGISLFLVDADASGVVQRISY